MMKKAVTSLLTALSKADDKPVIENLQAQLYFSLTLLKIKKDPSLENCIEESHIITVINKYCVQPSINNKALLRKLIQEIETSC